MDRPSFEWGVSDPGSFNAHGQCSVSNRLSTACHKLVFQRGVIVCFIEHNFDPEFLGFLRRHTIVSGTWHGLAPEFQVPTLWLYPWGLPQIPCCILSNHDISSAIGSAQSCGSSIRASCTTTWTCCRALSYCGALSKQAVSLHSANVPEKCSWVCNMLAPGPQEMHQLLCCCFFHGRIWKMLLFVSYFGCIVQNAPEHCAFTNCMDVFGLFILCRVIFHSPEYQCGACYCQVGHFKTYKWRLAKCPR